MGDRYSEKHFLFRAPWARRLPMVSNLHILLVEKEIMDVFIGIIELVGIVVSGLIGACLIALGFVLACERWL